MNLMICLGCRVYVDGTAGTLLLCVLVAVSYLGVLALFTLGLGTRFLLNTGNTLRW